MYMELELLYVYSLIYNREGLRHYVTIGGNEALWSVAEGSFGGNWCHTFVKIKPIVIKNLWFCAKSTWIKDKSVCFDRKEINFMV